MSKGSYKPCSKAGCGALVPRGASRCDEHKHIPDERESGWAATQAKRTPEQNQRTSNHKWRKFRKRMLRRDGWLCVQCKSLGRIRAADQLDHIVPIAQGGAEFSPINVQSLCKQCHHAKTLAERRAQGRGGKQTSGD